MIRSMTGFGRAELKTKSAKIIIEIRTLNHKYFDITSRVANGMYILEDDIRKIVQEYVKRGKVNLNLSYEGIFDEPSGVSVDKRVAKRYTDAFYSLKKALRLKGEIEVKDLINLPGVMLYKGHTKDPSLVWPLIKKTLDKSLTVLVKDRLKEGRVLYAEFNKRLVIIEKAVQVVDKRSSLNIEEYKKALSEKIKDLTGGFELDKGRLEVEVALFAKNCDITEELLRLKNHTKNFKELISNGLDVGKQLDFVAQEMQREINTIGAKTSDFKISQKVILIKSEIEKIREQLKNVE